ncbi:hypothetical protein FRC00_010780, partial [Tulasnella sp. 408]
GIIYNGADISALLSILDEYSRTIWTFVNGIPVDHLRQGDKAELRLARDVIAGWYFQLEQALQLLKDAGLREKNSGFLRRAKRRRALRRCVNELTTAHERLEGNIAPNELTIVRTLPPTSNYRHSFWNGFVEADVRGQAKLVKIYRNNNQAAMSDDVDGEVEFYGDLQNLQRRT